MPEYRTKPLDRLILLAELAAVRDALSLANVVDVSVSFGWDSNLPIDQMWKDKTVPVEDLLSFIANSEISGVIHIGRADVFIDAPEFVFTLGHESDAQVKGAQIWCRNSPGAGKHSATRQRKFSLVPKVGDRSCFIELTRSSDQAHPTHLRCTDGCIVKAPS